MRKVYFIAVICIGLASCNKTEDQSVVVDSTYHYVGEFYQGGMVAIIDEMSNNEHGVIITLEDIASDTNWLSAISICDSLELNGYSDWYLPTSVEIRDGGHTDASGFEGFTGLEGNYWSSTEVSATYAYFMQAGVGIPNGLSSALKTSNLKIRAVRKF